MKTKLKILLLIIVTISSTSVFAKHYYRFWRGHIEKNMTEDHFVKGLNKFFIPETVAQGKDHGLNSYLPVLIPRDKLNSNLPDELALVVYENEKKYKAIRKMPRGARYQKMHWEYFNKKNSKSRVPQEFDGHIEVESAYDLLESNANWQKGKVQFLMRKFKNGFSKAVKSELKKYFYKIKSNSDQYGIISYIVLVDHLGIYEYALYKKDSEPKTESILNSNSLVTSTNIVLKSSNTSIKFNEGVNRQFLISR